VTGGGAIGGAGGGVTAATGGWVSGPSKVGAAAGPDGGAKLIAALDGGSGTAAGGIGGGRSLNSCACADDDKAIAPHNANAAVVRSPAPRLDLASALPHPTIPLVFTENEANSSLRRKASVPIPRFRIRYPYPHAVRCANARLDVMEPKGIIVI
jgi:hypothetical protein